MAKASPISSTAHIPSVSFIASPLSFFLLRGTEILFALFNLDAIDKFENHVAGFRHRGLDGGRQTHAAFEFVAEVVRRAADDQHARVDGSHRGREMEDADGVHAVRVHRSAGVADIRKVRLDSEERSGRLAARQGVDEDDGVPRVEESVGEVEAANAEVLDRDGGGQWTLQQGARDFDTESVVAEEDVADARDEDGRLHAGVSAVTGSTSSGE